MPPLKHLRSPMHLRQALVCALGAWHLLSGGPIAQAQDSTKKVAAKPASQDSAKKAPAAADSAKPLTADQLDALVAPIALYPDELLGQTLVASTYPLEIVQLQQWLAKHPKLKDKELADSVAKQPWDPSIQSMAAIPDLVKRLADDIQWTTQLGNAFLAQQTQVMDAVQRMRKKAKDKGALETNEQQKVETKVVEQKQVIVVESANPEVIYVPSYSPTVVYGPPVYAYPPIYYPPYTPGMAFVSFGVGMMWGAAMWGGSCCYARWGGGGYGNVNINVNNNFNRNTNINGGRGGNWSHNPQHRGGAPYADARSNSKYGSQNQRSGQNQRGGGAGVSDRSAAGGQGQRSAGASDRSASGGTGRSGGADRSASGGGFSGGGDRGSASTPRSSGSSYGGGGFGGGSGGYSGSNARASSSRGSSSMGSRGGYGGGSRGGGGRRR
jgi:hypothetical protein